jgi:hypothetical protein
MRKWFVYSCPPIDEWRGASTFEAYLEHLSANGEDLDEIEVFVRDFEEASLAVVARTIWEGDGIWRVCSLPELEPWGRTRLIFVVKQRNNGSTFIASEVELPWLAGFYCERARDRAVSLDGVEHFHVARIRRVFRAIVERRQPTN